MPMNQPQKPNEQDQPSGRSDPTRPCDPTRTSGLYDRRKAFRNALLSNVRHGPQNSRVPHRRYGVLSAYPIQPISNGQPTCRYEAAMIAGDVLHDASRVRLDDAKSIRDFMARRLTIPAEFEEIMAGALGSGDLDDISEELAEAAVDYPKLVRCALTGKLESAVRAMPAIGAYKEGRGSFSWQNEEDLLMLLVGVSQWLMLAALCARARAARRRFFKPTGIQALDRQAGKRATTVATAACGLEAKRKRAAQIADLYWVSKDRHLTAEEESKITSDPGLVQHGRRELARLEAEYGDDLPAFVESWQRVVRHGNRYIRRRLRAASRTKANLTLTKHNGEEPLMLLFLACLQVSAWNTDTPDESTKKWDSINDGDRPKFNAVYRALKHIRLGLAPQPVDMPTRANTMARELFFLLRNLVVNDPHAHGFTGRGKAKIEFGKIEKVYAVQNAKRGMRGSRGNKGIRGSEPFATDVITGFREVYDQANAQGNLALLEEVHGAIWRQMHL